MEPRFLSDISKIVKHPKRKALSFSIRPNVDADEGVIRRIASGQGNLCYGFKRANSLLSKFRTLKCES